MPEDLYGKEQIEGKERGTFMKAKILFNRGWTFRREDGEEEEVDLPHTWNGRDGQDGGNDYIRRAAVYTKKFTRPALLAGERCVLLFKGVNSQASVVLNGMPVCTHEGGYSSFAADITEGLQDENVLEVTADNTAVESVYPQTADFTFYGGIYRDIYMCIFAENSFVFGDCCAPELKADCSVRGDDGVLKVHAFVSAKRGYSVKIEVFGGGEKVAEGVADSEIVIPSVHLWNGVEDPYMYYVVATLLVDGRECDEAAARVGFRTYRVDPKNGFFLNGKPYPLHGVSRHQDRPGIGNAITKREHEEDMALIKEMGANAIRLAHYQHDDYFYDLCDRNGMVVWAEVPYISRHMNGADGNIMKQMQELIRQQYDHPSICFWGISNEITMKRTDTRDMLRLHREMNELCHQLDPSRLTALACFAMCSPVDKTSRMTDVVGWNLYLGWYVPGLFLNDLWLWLYRLLNPKGRLCFSEYGAEGMPNIHSAKPRRFDNSEEYQAIYHEYMIKFFARNPFLWGTFVWNMFDFASDGRDQGGDPGKNHKGLVTFDRKLKKDAFYLYKAHWSKEPVLHLCGSRYVNRCENKSSVTVYSNVGAVEVYNNGKLVAKSDGGKVFRCKVKLEKKNDITVKAGKYTDSMTVYKVDRPDPSYIVTSGDSRSWEK